MERRFNASAKQGQGTRQGTRFPDANRPRRRVL